MTPTLINSRVFNRTQMTAIPLLLLLKPLPLRPQPPPQQLLAAFLTIVQLAKTPRVRATVKLVGPIFGAFAINTATTKTENEILEIGNFNTINTGRV